MTKVEVTGEKKPAGRTRPVEFPLGVAADQCNGQGRLLKASSLVASARIVLRSPLASALLT